MILGIAIGALLMFVIAYNYHFMINQTPDSGGIYSFVKHTFNGDHAFLASWFLIIVYTGILWANVTSVALFSRYLFGDLFRFGRMYAISGYDVYAGEVLLGAGVLLLIGGLTLINRRVTSCITFGMVLVFVAAIVFVSLFSLIRQNGVTVSNVSFASDENHFGQIVAVLSMSPWAFIGFESISHSAGGFSFKTKHTLKILLISLTVSALIYIMLCQISVMAYPEYRYGLVVCDVNDLKYVNDKFGHDYGDEYICKACQMICRIYADSLIFRTGGDEFVVIIEGEEHARRDELLRQLQRLSLNNVGIEDGIVIAAGMAVKQKGDSFQDVFHRADKNMYREKRKLKEKRPSHILR